MCRVGKNCHIPAVMKWPTPTQRYTNRSIRKWDVFARKDASAFINIVNRGCAADSGSCCYRAPRIFSVLAALTHSENKRNYGSGWKTRSQSRPEKVWGLGGFVVCFLVFENNTPHIQIHIWLAQPKTHIDILWIVNRRPFWWEERQKATSSEGQLYQTDQS